MKKTNQGFIIPLLVIIIVALVIGGGLYIHSQKEMEEGIKDERVATTTTVKEMVPENNADEKTPTQQPIIKAPIKIEVSKNSTCGFAINSLTANSKVSFPLTVTGTIDNTNAESLGCSWQMFEGQGGSAQLYYMGGDGLWHPLGASAPVVVSNWTSKSSPFTSILNFNNEGIGLSTGTLLKIVFAEENASGKGQADTAEIQVVLK